VDLANILGFAEEPEVEPAPEAVEAPVKKRRAK
jgi:hypothetical protein